MSLIVFQGKTHEGTVAPGFNVWGRIGYRSLALRWEEVMEATIGTADLFNLKIMSSRLESFDVTKRKSATVG